MSDLSFQRGEILTAAKLNLLVQAVTSGAPSAAVGKGNVPPAQPHQVRQREFSSYVPVRRPIYIDQTSPHWPLANGSPGWYWRESAGSSLTHFPLDLAPGDAVYLQTELSPFGLVEKVIPQNRPSTNVEWNPFEQKKGVICEQLGVVAADPYKAGSKATTLQFFEAPASPVIPLLLTSPPSTGVSVEAPGTPPNWLPSFMPPGTYLSGASLLGHRLDNTRLLTPIKTDGGLILKERITCYASVIAGEIEIIPRLAILPAPSTEPPATPPPIGTQLPPGSWHEMAAVDIAGQRLALNMAWLNPWMAYINLAVSGGSGTLHQTWKKEWGLPGIDSPPGSFDIGSQAWRVVSKSGPFAYEYRTPTMPDSSFLSLAEDVILQAEGTYVSTIAAPNTSAPGTAPPATETILQPMLFQAYIRRQLAPATCAWYVWYDDCWTQLPWI